MKKHTEALIAQRTREYVYRTLYWTLNNHPKSLQHFVEQEVFVQRQTYNDRPIQEKDTFIEIEKFYTEYGDSEEYGLIFNFFYGDEASISLGYPIYGRSKCEGFRFAKHLASKSI